MLGPQRAQAGDVGGGGSLALRTDGLQRPRGVHRVPQHADIDHEPECCELVFHAFAVALAQLALLAVADPAGQAVAGLLPVLLGQHPPPEQLVVEEGSQVGAAIELAKLDERAADWGGLAAADQVAEQLGGLDRAGAQRPGDPQQVVPVVADDRGVDPGADQALQGAVVGGGVDAVQGGAAASASRGASCRPSIRKAPKPISLAPAVSAAIWTGCREVSCSSRSSRSRAGSVWAVRSVSHASRSTSAAASRSLRVRSRCWPAR